MPDASKLSPTDSTLPRRLDGVTLVVTERVRPSQVAAYEAWARDLHALQRLQPGFIGLHVLRDASGPMPEYVTLVRFASPDALAAWRASAEYARALKQLPHFTAGEVDYRESVGLEAWFDRPARAPAPALWKNVLVGVVGVYPLILLFSALFTPFTKDWPWYLAILSTVVPSTIFLNWPVLPLLSRWLRRWLYPAPGQGQ
ncbi:antibiotic biosynthesis monooxygenase [Deinococcus sp. QL22]|uniref:antibiotic biosynthesis monooxygenase n=1 Tax=Deinococcus sp. QL22 TaxID=2939437 RepID=UPI002017C7FC|nr:antibiotic biosynthesis monooxygenase [Deinococcus sp. QL22]UQN06652.1 antibiotic biosynthesis monooxygenase [Deinococcus sp. QL22]